MTKHYTHEGIEAMLDAATPGEWYEKDHDAFVKTAEGFELRITKVNHYNDVPFIAAAPAIVRQLLDENKAMRAGLSTPTKAPPHQRHKAKKGLF